MQLTSATNYRPQLDGLRAIAVSIVIVAHWVPDSVAWKSWFPFSIAGVRLFFVLSGFLITGILLDQRAAIEAGRQSVGRSMGVFFLRRLTRLVPAYYLLLVVGAALGIGVIGQSLAWHLTYLSNAYLILEGRWAPGVFHLWSLAVEEQFYIAWACLIFLAPRRWIAPAVIGAVALAPAFRTLGVFAGWSGMTIRLNPIACLDTLALGALLALSTRAEWAEAGARHRDWLLRLGLAVGLAIVAGVVLVENLAGSDLARAVGIPLLDLGIALVSVWCVARAAHGFTGPAGAFLQNPAVVYVGLWSYAIYLYHAIVGPLVRQAFPTLPFGATFVLALLTVLALSWASWLLVETPARNFGRRFRYIARERQNADVRGDESRESPGR